MKTVKTSKFRAALVIGAAAIGISLLGAGSASAVEVPVAGPYPDFDACVHALRALPPIKGEQGRNCDTGKDGKWYVVSDIKTK
ncbi:hypothetical protein ACFWY9_24640 [Amycolatopsis sp. NPDC059027]|uniref:hypothetical protein n=1 Tax=unclassified Amycolatopsis TaxID=2618356 RepID=UPI0036720C57